MYGGSPSPGVCARCIERGENNQEFAAKLKAQPLPSVPRTAANLAKAVATDIAQGMPRRTEEEAQAILKDFCEPCEFYRDSDHRCSKCGCFLATKTAWKSQHCPVGKW